MRKVSRQQNRKISKPVERLRRKAEGPVWAASCTLLCATLFDYAEMCQRLPKDSRCGVMEKFMGVAFPGTTITLPLRSDRLKHR